VKKIASAEQPYEFPPAIRTAVHSFNPSENAVTFIVPGLPLLCTTARSSPLNAEARFDFGFS
jgi:hypothetical protein